jgi:Toprim domain-containing protein
MQTYFHERSPKDNTAPDNTVWPLMSTDGVDVDDMKRYLQDRGLSYELAEANGWYPSRRAGDTFLRIVIPALSTEQGHVYWQARAVSPNVQLRYQSPKGPRHGALVSVRAWPEDVRTREVIIVEGPTDALAAADCEVDAVALMGMNPGRDALEHLIKLVDNRPALIVLDNEPEAQVHAANLAMILASAGSQAHSDRLRFVKDLAAMKFAARRAWIDSRLEAL